MILAHSRPGRPVFRDLFQQIVVCIEEEGEPAGKFVDVHPGLQRGLHIGDAVGQGKGDLLRRCGAGLPDVVAGDGNGVPLRHVLGAEFKGVRDQTHGGRPVGKCMYLWLRTP